jgi:hypothetical protein
LLGCVLPRVSGVEVAWVGLPLSGAKARGVKPDMSALPGQSVGSDGGRSVIV